MHVPSQDESAQPRPSPPAERLSCVVEEFDRRRFPPRDGWLRLFERAAHSHVTHHPDYVQAVFPDLVLPGWTVTCRRGTEPVAMAILMPKRCRLGPAVLPGASSTLVGLRLVGLGLLGADEPDVTCALVRSIAGEVERRGIRVVEFENLQEESPLWESLQSLCGEGFRFAPVDAFDAHHRIRFPQAAEEYWSSFPSRHRYRLRKERKRIGEYTVRRYTQPSDVDDWLTAAHTVSQNTWQSRRLGLRIRNNAEEREYLTFLATLGALRAYVLFCGEQPAAFVQSHKWRGVYYYDELGFDRNFVEQNPGKVLLQEILTDLMTHDRPHTFDFGLGDADYKSFFANEQTRSATLWMFPPGVRSLWQVLSIEGSRKAGRTARDLIARIGCYQSVRRARRNAAAQ